MSGWQNIAGRGLTAYPDKPNDWHQGYYEGCHDAGVAHEADLYPIQVRLCWTRDRIDGFHQGRLDVQLAAPRTSDD